MIRIEKGLPIPEDVRLGGYPFKDMKVGDSFALPRAKKSALYAAVHHFKKKSGSKAKFTIRSVIEDGIDMVRVWRLE